MKARESVVAVFDDHVSAEEGVRRLISGGTSPQRISIIGKGYHTEDKVTGFYNAGDRIKLWGRYGATWGGLWGLLLGGVFMSLPIVGPVLVLGHLGAMVAGALEGAALLGGLGVIGGALAGLGIPKNSVLQYEEAVKADKFLVVVHGSAEVAANAKRTLGDASTVQLDHHHDVASGAQVAHT